MVIMSAADLGSQGQPGSPVTAPNHLDNLHKLSPDQVHGQDEGLVIVPTLVIPLGPVNANSNIFC